MPAISPDSDPGTQTQRKGLAWSAIGVAGEPFHRALRGVKFNGKTVGQKMNVDDPSAPTTLTIVVK